MRNPLNTIAGRLVFLLSGSILLSQILLFIVFFNKAEDKTIDFEDRYVVRKIASVYSAIQKQPLSEQKELLTVAGSPDTFFYISEELPSGSELISNTVSASLFKKKFGEKKIYLLENEIHTLSFLSFWFYDFEDSCFLFNPTETINESCPFSIISLELDNKKWLTVRTFPGPNVNVLFAPALFSAIFSLIGITLISFITIRRIMRPLRDLSDAAERFGRGEEIQPLDISGPEELSATIKTFNAMQERLSRFIRDRTRMLASISHDLRTPITSLRLRAEFIENTELQTKVIRTLEDMQTMVESSLSFTRQESWEELSDWVDIVNILEEISEDNANIEFLNQTPSVLYRCRPVSIKRALRNLTNNALQYGQKAIIELETSSTSIKISVRDRGPGVPEHQLQQIFDPFTRLDEARNTETGNAGLGLAITRTIIHNHGGYIHAENHHSGLNVIISLPLDI